MAREGRAIQYSVQAPISQVYVPVRHYRKLQIGMIGAVVPELPIGGVYQAKVTVVDRVFDSASSTFGGAA
jgi:hypothetical protein